MVYVKLVLEH